MEKATLQYVKIDKNNFELAVSFQNSIFPKNDAYRNYYESVYGLRDATYYLVYKTEMLIGIVGLYFEDADPQSAWLGWFGVKKSERRKGYGSHIIAFFEETAKSKGYKYARLFTDKYNNDVAINFYKHCGYMCEDYKNEDDSQSLINKVIIFSKSLVDDKCPLWNNKSIKLTEQLAKENYRKQ